MAEAAETRPTLRLSRRSPRTEGDDDLSRGQARRRAVDVRDRRSRARRATTPDYFALRVMNTMLGELFQSRLNANIREEKGYSYGVGSDFAFGTGPVRSAPAATSSRPRATRR